MNDLDSALAADTQRLATVVKLITTRGLKVEGLHMLDLACRTGTFTIGLARLGARVHGIEGRRENLDLVWQWPTHPRASFQLDDVRNLNPKIHGVHDVTLCLGILYHLTAAEAIQLLRAMHAVTRRFAIIDTHVALAPSDDAVTVDDVVYDGVYYPEPEGPWAAIGNAESWWFTEPALQTALVQTGWELIEWETDVKGWYGEAPDRRWLVVS